MKDLDETILETEYTWTVEYLKLKGSGWVYDRLASVRIDPEKNVTQCGSSYVVFFMCLCCYTNFISFESSNQNR